jgi:hypothetical protein
MRFCTRRRRLRDRSMPAASIGWRQPATICRDPERSAQGTAARYESILLPRCSGHRVRGQRQRNAPPDKSAWFTRWAAPLDHFVHLLLTLPDFYPPNRTAQHLPCTLARMIQILTPNELSGHAAAGSAEAEKPVGNHRCSGACSHGNNGCAQFLFPSALVRHLRHAAGS